MIRVMLADDHAVVRNGIRAMVEKKTEDISIDGEAADGKEVLRLSRAHPADVYILDIAMPGLNGLETAERLLRKNRNSRIILLSMYDTHAFVEKALNTGVMGYLLKESAADDILFAIREVHAGRYFLSPKIAKYVVRGFIGGKRVKSDKIPGVRLTPCEREVLQLAAEGNSNKEIAAKLDRAVNTVHVHRNNLMHKLDIHSQTQLVRYAIKEGLSHL
jgi:DNA-binding NarL/FixJ family response regulator